MKCPRCRSEVGNQPVCPYCGGTIYLGGNAWDDGEYSRRTTPIQDLRQSGRTPLDNTNLERKMRSLETKIHLLMVLQGGTFLIMIFMLLILALT